MKNIFLTGSTGFLGGELMKRLLIQQPESHFYLLIRNRGKKTASERCSALVRQWANEWSTGYEHISNRIHLVEGDLMSPLLGLSSQYFHELSCKIDVIFHLAASIDLLGKYNKLYRTNVEGTRKLLEFATLSYQNNGLTHFHYVSTAYVSGNTKGIVYENELDKGQTFSNDYERVKMEAECAVQEAKNNLPITVYRPSIVVGDSRTGYAPDDCATLDFIKLVLTGHFPIIPSGKKFKLDIIPVNYVADAIACLSTMPKETIGQTYHLTAGKNHCISSMEIMKIAKSVIEEKQISNGNQGELKLPIQMNPFITLGLAWIYSKFKTSTPAKLVQIWITYSKYNWYCRSFNDTGATRLLEINGIYKPSIPSALKVMMQRNLTLENLHNWQSSTDLALIPSEGFNPHPIISA